MKKSEYLARKKAIKAHNNMTLALEEYIDKVFNSNKVEVKPSIPDWGRNAIYSGGSSSKRHVSVSEGLAAVKGIN